MPLHGLADRAAIFDDGFILGEIAHRDLVAERNVVEQLNFAGGFAFERQRANGGTFL